MSEVRKDRSDRRNTCLDYLIIGGIAIVGMAEAAHLAAVVFGWTFTRCATLFWWILGVCVLLFPGLLLFARHKSAKRAAGHTEEHGAAGHGAMGAAEFLLYAFFAAAVITQIIFICMGNNIYRQGDMTVETVGSFLASDGIYRVNPITGAPYAEGIPSRLKILCLPTLYGSICKMTGLSPRVVVWRIVPLMTLAGCYTAFASLGNSLFPEDGVLQAGAAAVGLLSEDKSPKPIRRRRDGKKLACFMAAVSILLWVGTYGYGVDGFDLLYCGYRGVVIRNLVLAPWLFSLCLRRKWFCAFLCILAEACMVWTLYGMGVCLFITVGMAVVQLFYRMASPKDVKKVK